MNLWPPSERRLCRLAVSAGQVWGSGGAWTALAGGTAIRWACPRFVPPAPGGHAGRSVCEYFKSRFQLLSFSIVFLTGSKHLTVNCTIACQLLSLSLGPLISERRDIHCARGSCSLIQFSVDIASCYYASFPESTRPSSYFNSRARFGAGEEPSQGIHVSGLVCSLTYESWLLASACGSFIRGL